MQLHIEACMQEAEKVVLKAAAISAVAKDVLGIKTLEVQNRDCLDFHDLSVASIYAALAAAYEAGYQDSSNLYKRQQ